MKKNSQYVDNEKLFLNICRWQDFRARLDVIEKNNALINEYKRRISTLKQIDNPCKKRLIDDEIRNISEKIKIMQETNDKIELNPKEKKENRIIYEEIGTDVLKIVDRFSSQPCYSGYIYLEDMKMLAIEHCISKALHKFNRNQTQNPFAYLTQTITWAFWQILNKEKKLFKDKFKFIKDNVDEKLLKLDYNDYTEDFAEKVELYTQGLLDEINEEEKDE